MSVPACRPDGLGEEAARDGARRRSPECDLVLETKGVSRHHCRIVYTAEQVIVEDLGSMQGTRVNGSRVVRAPLSDGDRLEIAKQVFEVLSR